MYSFTISKKAYTIPEKASELTLGQFIAINNLNQNDELGLLTILMGETPTSNVQNDAEAAQFKRELNHAYALIGVLQQDIEHCLASGVLLATPKSVNILGMDIEIKENFVNTLPYWGYVHTKAAIIERVQSGKDEQFNATDLIPGILAHNLYSLVTKSPYNEAKAEEFQEDVLTGMNFIQAMQLGNFFLFGQKKLWVSKRKRFIVFLSRLRSKLVSMFLKNTGQQTFSIPLVEGMSLSGKK